MFTNLKNKLIEEVKASPSKFQQFANAAQAAVSSSSSTTPNSTDSTNTSTTNENFFSITEEDTPQNSPYRPQKLPVGASLRGRASIPLNNGNGGAIPRTRKLSNSSVASDVSFRLPPYDAPAVYHLQSDFDASESEMEDTTSTARLDLVTKEQLYDAYKKSLDRYRNYRARYTDLAKKYKDLERDSSKARSVLVETQEKAIRRISELREQCALEQQAKAHLEEALRIEMEDLNYKMQAYQTKLKLLGENPDTINSIANSNKLETKGTLIDLSENTASITELVKVNEEVLQQKIFSLEQQLKESETQILDLSEKHKNATIAITTLRKQEEENALLLAQTKQAVYSELEDKENEVKILLDKLKKLEYELDSVNKKYVLLGDSKEQLKKLQSAKKEADAKIIASEHMLNSLKADLVVKDRQILAAEEQLNALKIGSEQSLRELRQQNAQLNEMMQRYQENELRLAEVEKELNCAKCENSELHESLVKSEEKIKDIEYALAAEREIVATLNSKQLESEAMKINYEQQSRRMEQLESEIQLLHKQSTSNENELGTALKTELEKVNKRQMAELNESQTNADHKDKQFEMTTNKLNKQKKQHNQQQQKLSELQAEIDKLKNEMSNQEQKLNKAEQVEAENEELKERVTSILKEIAIVQEHMQEVQNSHTELEQENQNLKLQVESMTRQQEDVNMDSVRLRDLWQESEERAQDAKTKLEEVVLENTKLTERNCLLEEQTNYLAKQIADRNHLNSATATDISNIRLKLEATEDDLEKLNEKMKQVLDENSRIYNAQELMDHDYRSLQDKYDALEKEKLIVEDTLSIAHTDLQASNEANIALEIKIKDTTHTLQSMAEKYSNYEVERNELHKQIYDLNDLKAVDERLKTTLQEEKQHSIKLQSEIKHLSKQLQAYEHNAEILEQTREELMLCKAQRDSLEEKILTHQTNTDELQRKVNQFEEDIQQLKTIIKDKENTIEKLQETENDLRLDLNNAKDSHEVTVSKLEQLKSIQKILKAEIGAKGFYSHADIERLHESNDVLQVEMDKLKEREQIEVGQMERSTYEKSGALQESTEIAKKLAEYDLMQKDIEYFNKHTKEMEAELVLAKELTQEANANNDDLRRKLRLLECEVCMLRNNIQHHEAELTQKDALHTDANNKLAKLQQQLVEQTTELTCQADHANFVTQQNDTTQKDLLQTQKELAESIQQIEQLNIELEKYRVDKNEQLLETLKADNARNSETIETLNKDVSELTMELENRTKEVGELQLQLKENSKTENIHVEVQKTNTASTDAEHLRSINEELQRELEVLKYKSNATNKNMQQEIEDLQINNKQMAERIMELERLRATIQAQEVLRKGSGQKLTESFVEENEKAALKIKLKEIMNEVEDVTNRNLFLEQKCENFLILEQSNERLKLQNAKLSRQLDETLVSMQHCESLSANTEFEYLKNIMFQYLTGNTNNETLVKVISAVLKFSPQQTQVALEKEHQRRSLLNKIL